MPDQPHHEVFPHLEAALEFRASLTQETDRGCALMAAAYLSDQLEYLLRATFVDDLRLHDEMFRSLGPLGAFSARIEMAYALGLLPPRARRDLHLIRKIRNEFGHVAKPLSFTDEPITARCLELYYGLMHVEEQRPRARFTHVVMGIAAVIHMGILLAHRCTTAVDIRIDTQMRQEFKEIVEYLDQAIRRSIGTDINEGNSRS